MSLITDTLNKMKKGQSSEENDDKMMAPPALRNAVIDTKKYQEFVKNAEIKDINGHKAPLKGFIIVSIILIAVIGAATIYFINKEDNTLMKQAGIISNNQQPAQNANNGDTVQSLGKPYNPDEKVSQQNISAPAADTAKPASVQNQQIGKAVNSQPLNNIQERKIQESMSSMPDSNQDIGVKKENSKTQAKQGPVNIIPANQLFILTPQTAPVNNQPAEQPAQNNTAEPVQNNIQNNKPAAEKKDNVSKTQVLSSNAAAGDISQEQLKRANEYTQKQVDEEKARALKNAQLIQENYAEQKQKASLNKNSVKDYADKSEIAEVKAIKTKDPAGTVSASTVSLYNQYVTTQ